MSKLPRAMSVLPITEELPVLIEKYPHVAELFWVFAESLCVPGWNLYEIELEPDADDGYDIGNVVGTARTKEDAERLMVTHNAFIIASQMRVR